LCCFLFVTAAVLGLAFTAGVFLFLLLTFRSLSVGYACSKQLPRFSQNTYGARLNPIALVLKSGHQRSPSFMPQAFHVHKSDISQPFQLLVNFDRMTPAGRSPFYLAA
jgi:hypothetical protein